MSIQLWFMALDRILTAEEQVYLMEHLPEARRKRLEAVTDHHRWREPLCAYGLLRLALGESLGWTSLPEISLEKRGKPFFPEHPKVFFSISHTEGAVLVGLSTAPIGVDLEQKRRPLPRVQQRLERQGKTAEQYYEDWVRYEAAVKCTGEGIMPHHNPNVEKQSCLLELPGYAAAFCGGGEAEPIRQVPLEQLFLT